MIVKLAKKLLSSNIFMLFVICQKLLKHFHLNATFVNKDHKRVLGLFCFIFVSENKTKEFLKVSLMLSLFKKNLERLKSML